jgi:hypothetical protein
MPPRRQTGAGLLDQFKKGVSALHKYAKEQKVISKGLKHFGFKKAAGIASIAGYGKRRRRKRRAA